MKQILYYVASSIDGFISGSNDDVSGYVSEGDGVAKYLSDLSDFDTVILILGLSPLRPIWFKRRGRPHYPVRQIKHK
jgi:hypothetical protein